MQAPSVGTILRQRYRLETKIGAGGYGSVWAAEDLRGASRVAVKVLSDRALASRDARKRFAREAEVLLSLEHPGIVGALDYFDGDEATPAYLVLELVEGRSLAAHIAARTRIGEHVRVAEALEIFVAIAEAVDSAHARGVIHRDLKPLNVMIASADHGPRLKVLDFGLAKILHGDVVDATTLGRRLGSFLYMAPEQALAQRTSEATDVFALATLLFELLTLRRAWARDDLDQPLPALDGPIPFKQVNNPAHILQRIARGARPKPSRSRPELGPEVDVVFEQALAIDPRERPPSARALIADMQRVLGAAAARSRSEPPTDLADLPEVPEQSLGVITTLPDEPPDELTPLLPSPLDAPSSPASSARADDAPTKAGLPPKDAELAAARLPVLGAPEPRAPTAAAPAERPLQDPAGPVTPTEPRLVPPPASSSGQRPLLLLTALAVASVALVAIVARSGQESAPRSAIEPAVAPPTPAPTAAARATPRPSPDAAPDAGGSDAGELAPRSKRAVRRAAPAKPAREGPRTRASIRALKRELESLRANPADMDGVERLAGAIRRQAAKLDDPARIRRIERLTRDAIVVGDLESLARGIRALEGR